jgi:branched-chain amino acid transport system permease protein
VEYVQNLLIFGGLYSLLAFSGYVVTVTGQVSLGQQGFYAIGAYLAGIGTALWGWSLPPALLLGMLAAAAIGMVVGVPALRIRGLYLAVATLAFGEIVRLSLLSVEYNRVIEGKRVGPVGAEGFRHIRWFPDHGWTSLEVMTLILIVTLLVVVALALVDRSRVGARMRAVGHDEMAAAMVGVNVALVKVLAFVAGAAIAGLAGGLYAHQATFVSHEQFTIELGMFVAAYVLVGGSGNVLGPLCGVTLFMLLIEGLRFMGWLRYVLFGAAIVVCMILRPNGLIDDRVARRLSQGLTSCLRPIWARIVRRSPIAAS